MASLGLHRLPQPSGLGETWLGRTVERGEVLPLDRGKQRLIDVTPGPMHATFEVGSDKGMTGFFVVLVGMLVLRLLTAANMSTDKTHPQGGPGISALDTLEAHVCFRCHVLYEWEVLARLDGELPGPSLAEERVDQFLDHMPCLDRGDERHSNEAHVTRGGCVLRYPSVLLALF